MVPGPLASLEDQDSLEQLASRASQDQMVGLELLALTVLLEKQDVLEGLASLGPLDHGASPVGTLRAMSHDAGVLSL